MAVEELGHDVGFQEHVVRRASLLALEQVRVVTHLHTQGDRQCIIKALLMLVLGKSHAQLCISKCILIKCSTINECRKKIENDPQVIRINNNHQSFLTAVSE